MKPKFAAPPLDMLYFPFQAKEEIELKKDCLQVQSEGEEEARR